MVEAAKPRRRSRGVIPGLGGISADPLENAMRGETQNIADDLANTLATLGNVAESGIDVTVFKVPERGNWQWIRELKPPFSAGTLISELEANYGPGRYAVQVRANEKIKTTKYIEIAAPKSHQSLLGQVMPGLGQGDLLKMLLDRKPDDSGIKELMLMMMQMQQSNAQMQMQSQSKSTEMMVAIMTAMMGKNTDPSEQFAKIGALYRDFQAPQNTMKDFFEMLAAAKELTGGSPGADGFMGLAEKFAPMLTAMAQHAGAPAGQPTPAGALVPTLPAPLANRAPPPPVAGAAATTAANDAPASASAAHPILGLVQPEIEFFMARGHDPELAADAIADKLHAAGITREQLFAFGMEIQGPDGDYVGRLRALGLDVSQHTQWFESVLNALSEVEWTDGGPDGGEPDAGEQRPGGGGADAEPDEGAGPGRRAANPRAKQGGLAN